MAGYLDHRDAGRHKQIKNSVCIFQKTSHRLEGSCNVTESPGGMYAETSRHSGAQGDDDHHDLRITVRDPSRLLLRVPTSSYRRNKIPKVIVAVVGAMWNPPLGSSLPFLGFWCVVFGRENPMPGGRIIAHSAVRTRSVVSGSRYFPLPQYRMSIQRQV